MEADNSQSAGVNHSALARWLLYTLILLSGGAGLVYEVVWARQLTLFIGNTAVANAAVLTAFMAGLAMGSLYLGKRADVVASPLRLYAILEILIGCYGATTPWLFDLLQVAYAQMAGVTGVSGAYSHIPRFMVAVVAMLVPTFLMGGTLPLLVRHFTRSLEQAQSVTSRVYGINTLGATLGAFAAGYLLLPAIGITDTLLTAAAINLLVGLGVYRLLAASQPQVSQVATKPEPGGSEGQPTPVRHSGLLLTGFALSGFAALLYQVVWIHALVLVIGISVYAFSTVLTVYLAGIGLGSLVIGRFFNFADTGRGLKLAFLLQLGIALSAVASLSLISDLPYLFVKGWAKLHQSFPLFQAYMFALAGMVILLPTLLLGALFPLICGVWSRWQGAIGKGVGQAYGANAVGTIAGSAIGGLLFLDWLGLEQSLWLASGISTAVAALFWYLSTPGKPILHRTVALPAAGLLLVYSIHGLPGLNQHMLQTEVFRHARDFVGADIRAHLDAYLAGLRFDYYKEGIHGTVSVVSWMDSGVRKKALMTNGKVDASTDSDTGTQVLLAQIPLFLHPNPKDVMVIGLGSGMTAGSALQTPSVNQVDILEISPEVVEASEQFIPENHDVLSDERSNLIIADARNYLLASDKKYDVIISEPSHSWVTGVANLFTRDFLDLVSQRLNPGGMLAQWYHIYGVNRESLKSLLKAVSDVFPHFSIWYEPGGDIIIVSSNQPLNLDYSQQTTYFTPSAIRAELAKIGIFSAERLMSYLMMSSEEVRGLLVGQQSNTDDRPVVEFNAPKYMYTFTTEDNIRMLFGELDTGEYQLPVRNLTQVDGDWVSVPFMGIDLQGDAVSLSVPDWEVVRTSVYSQDRDRYRLMGGMNGTVTLRKPWGEVVVHTTMAARGTPDSDVLFPMMDHELRDDGEPIAGELRGGEFVIYWRVVAADEPGMMKVVLASKCERVSGYDNYLLISSPYPGNIENREDINGALRQIAGILSCHDPIPQKTEGLGGSDTD